MGRATGNHQAAGLATTTVVDCVDDFYFETVGAEGGGADFESAQLMSPAFALRLRSAEDLDSLFCDEKRWFADSRSQGGMTLADKVFAGTI